MTQRPPIDQLLDVMAKLRDPENGCPWDIEQSFASIAPHTIEEAYEVADAIERDNMNDLKEELGDLLLQVVFHGQMARETGHFDFNDVAQSIVDKLITRHPHVFGSESIETADAQTRAWEDQKEQERRHKAATENRTESALDGVARGFPALLRSLKLQKRAARVGFDWPAPEPVLTKLREEIDELSVEMNNGAGHDRLHDELGDILFSCVNLARHLDVDPEAALRHANEKFQRRFQALESILNETDRKPQDASVDELDGIWNAIKSRE